jgi:hypothetical protein
MHGVKIIKDPNLDNFCSNVFGQIQEIVQAEFPNNADLSSSEFNEIKFVSFEDALKELVTTKSLVS